MGTIRKSVKQMIYALLKEKGVLTLKFIIEYVQSEREDVHSAHIRGVLNSDIKNGGKFFNRICRGKYSITDLSDIENIVE